MRDRFHPHSFEKGSKTPKAAHCPVAARCGGCQLGHLTYPEQLRLKQQKVEKLLGKLCKVEPILGMDDPHHYRNKVHAVIGTDRDKNPISGVYAMGTHHVVPVKSCLIEDQRADAIIQTIVGMIPRYKLRIYNENTHRGFLRHVLVRTGHVTGQILVVLVATAAEFPGGKAFVAELVERHPEITSVVLNVNQKETSMVLGTKDVVLHGTGYMEDELCGKRFRISPQSFYQVNARQTEILYRTAIEYAGLTGQETMLDAYCGTGTIGLCASDHVKQLIGVELNANAVRDAKENAKLNRVTNAKFFCDDAGRFMVKMAQEGLPLDVLMMDPPRSGSDMKFLNSVLTLKPKTIVYVSCNPETLARDAAVLVKGGYKAVKAVPVDMFPYTEHVETVVCLSREKADDCAEKPKMISEERSKYKSWSNLKKQMNDLLCDSLKGKISYFYTSYHEVHNAYGRATIRYENKELVSFSWIDMYKQESETSSIYHERKQEGEKVSYLQLIGELEKEKWMPEGKLCDADFINSLTIYLKTDIATSLNSDNYLLRVFAYMDRRVGKRTLVKIKDEVEKLPDWVKQFYQIRCEADGIVFPPKVITDETVMLFTLH